MKLSFLSVGGILLFLLASCGPSPDSIATMTASAWTPTPVPPTITPSPTPVPHSLTVKVTDAAGNPIVGASVVFPESGSGEPVAMDDSGQLSWNNLAGPNGSLSVSAQGYLKAEQALNLERGPNEVVITLERDLYGLLPSTACAAGENLLYMEDFQDGQTDMAHNTKDGGAPAPLGPVVDEAGNTVLIHDFTTPVGDYSTYLTQNSTGGFYEFGEAVWRFRFMMTQETGWGLSWNSARPTEFGGIMTGQSIYGIGFNTDRHIIVMRNIWDASGQTVYNVGKLDLVNKVLVLKPNLWHYLEISTYQGQLQVWLDGVSVVDVVDDVPLPPGGFSIGSGDSGIIYYDAISVCGLSAPFKSMPAPVPVTPKNL